MVFPSAARLHQLKIPFGLLVRPERPIAYQAIDGQPVDIVFMLLLPATETAGGIARFAQLARQESGVLVSVAQGWRARQVPCRGAVGLGQPLIGGCRAHGGAVPSHRRLARIAELWRTMDAHCHPDACQVQTEQ